MKYILLRIIYFVNELFPNRVGSEAVINSQPNFLKNGLVTTDSKIIVMVV